MPIGADLFVVVTYSPSAREPLHSIQHIFHTYHHELSLSISNTKYLVVLGSEWAEKGRP